MKAITARLEDDHIFPIHDAMWHRGIVGLESCIFNWAQNFEPEIITNNEIRIRPGIGMIQGRFFGVEPGTYDSINIANGTQGERRIDIIVPSYTVNNENDTQNCDWHYIQGVPVAGTPVAPSFTVGDLDAGDIIAECKGIEVELDGINIVAVRKLFDVSASLEDSRISEETIEAYKALGFDPAKYSGGHYSDLEMLLTFIADNNLTVAEYDEGMWHVKKYTNGYAECWTSGSKSVKFTAACNIGGYNGETITLNLPDNLFVEPPLMPIITGSTANDAFLNYVPAPTKTTVSFQFTNGFSGERVLKYTVFVIGKWK